MPVARRATPPTSQIREQLSVLNALSAWTDEGAEDPQMCFWHAGGVRTVCGIVQPLRARVQGSYNDTFQHLTAGFDVDSSQIACSFEDVTMHK